MHGISDRFWFQLRSGPKMPASPSPALLEVTSNMTERPNPPILSDWLSMVNKRIGRNSSPFMRPMILMALFLSLSVTAVLCSNDDPAADDSDKPVEIVPGHHHPERLTEPSKSFLYQDADICIYDIRGLRLVAEVTSPNYHIPTGF